MSRCFATAAAGAFPLLLLTRDLRPSAVGRRAPSLSLLRLFTSTSIESITLLLEGQIDGNESDFDRSSDRREPVPLLITADAHGSTAMMINAFGSHPRENRPSSMNS